MIKQEAHTPDDFRLQKDFYVFLVTDHQLSFSNCFEAKENLCIIKNV